jgi:hypothetical protein
MAQPHAQSLSRRFESATMRALRVVLGVPWITGRIGDPIDDERRQTRIGAFFDRRPRLLRTLAIVALIWGVGYLTWRIGWSATDSIPLAFGMLITTENYGL